MVEKLQKQRYLAGANKACGWNVPYGLIGLSRVTDRLHIGNRWKANSVILGNTTEAKDKAEVEARKVEQKYIDEILQIRKKNEEE